MTLPERNPSPEQAESWIRECLDLHPEGATLTVSGTCMEPALGEGLQISLRRLRGVPRLGDVVLVRTPAGLRLHRVLMRFGERIRTKGDRGVYLDPEGSVRDVIAVWNSTESKSRRLLRTGGSLARVFTRPGWGRARHSEPGDESHVRLLP